MKVCFLSSGIVPPWDDGLKNSLIELADALSALNTEVTVITSAKHSHISDRQISYRSVKIYAQPYYLPRTFMGSAIPEAVQMSLNAIYQTPRINRNYNFDILHSHSGAPLHALPYTIIKKMLKIPAVHSLHGLTDSRIGDSRMARKLLSRFDKVIVTTRNQHQDIRGVIPEAEIVPDGISLEQFHPQNKKEKEDSCRELGVSSPVIGFIGPLVKRKGFHNFLVLAKGLIKEIPQVMFLVMNSTSEKPVMAQIKGLEDRFVFTGYVEDRNKVINCMDITVFPFDYINVTFGQPIAILEVMACGKPVITTDVEGIDELIVHDANGRIAPPYDPVTLKEQVTALLNDGKKRDRLGQAATKTAGQYAIGNVARQINDIYRQILSGTVSIDA